MIKGYCAAAIVALAAVLGGGIAEADDLADQGRALLETHQDAVVTISMVLKQQFSSGGMSQDDESKTDVTGTVIDASGLTVVALSETDPTALIESMMGGRMPDMNISSEVAEAKILMRDGSEVAMRIVLRDKDLDLAFLRPLETPEEPMTFVNLDGPVEAGLLDQLFVINRLGRVAARAHAVAIERVEAVVERPRRFYVPGKDPTNSGLGCPAFSTDGKIVGFMVLRAVSGGGGGGMMDAQDNITPIILPAGDVLEIAAQAPTVDQVPDEAEAPAASEAEAAEDASDEEAN